jgi:hypothetical protein
MIENTVYQILSNISEITALIGTKIFHENNPNQNQSEYLIYQKTSHFRPLNIDGSSSVQSADFQIDIYSRSEDTARTLRDLLITATHGQSNSLYPDSIQQMFIDNDFSGYDPENNLYRITVTISLFF